MIEPSHNKILQHPDLEIDKCRDINGKDIFVGKSNRYEPFEATAKTAMDCFFKFNIQLSEQKVIASLIK